MEETQRLSALFRSYNCPGIARLVLHLAQKTVDGQPYLELGSSSWVDNDRVLDEITLVMRRYGFPHLSAYLVSLDEHREWHKHLYIGGRIPPLDWLTLFSRHIANISPQALDLFDRGCGGFVNIDVDGGTEIDIRSL